MANPSSPRGYRKHDSGHDDDHVSSRRQFLRQLGLLTTGATLLPGAPLRALGSSALAGALLDNPTDRVLVLIRLKGGNDGLNTIVPVYDYSAYANARPRLRYEQSQLLPLTPELAVGPDFAAAHDLWQRDAMRVINGVGYPDPNLSHFRSTDIVTSASDSDVLDASGWLGRHLNTCFPDYLTNLPDAPPAIQIGGGSSLTFSNEENVSLAVTVGEVSELATIAQTGELYDTQSLPDCRYGEELGYLRGIANSAFTYATTIEQAYSRGTNRVAYPGNPLADQLALVARLVNGGLDTRMYMVTLEGFDTHAAQPGDHARLLRHLGESVRSFYEDVGLGGDDQRVLTATFSEFGRRIEQNASDGTDHGTAAPQLLFGPALNGSGAHGDRPSLTDPDRDGNLKHTTDFRSVYATILERWLCLPSSAVDDVLGRSYPRLDLGFDCQSVSTAQPARGFATRLVQTDEGWAVRFDGEPGTYRVQLCDALGRVLTEDTVESFEGTQTVPLARGRANARGAAAFRLVAPSGKLSSGILPFLR